MTGKRHRGFGRHHRPVVLGQIRAGRSIPLAAIARGKAGDGDPRQLDKSGVEKGGVLALQEADAAEIMRQGDRRVRAFLGKDRARPFLARRVQRREDRGHRRPTRMPLLADLPRGLRACRASSNGIIGRPS